MLPAQVIAWNRQYPSRSVLRATLKIFACIAAARSDGARHLRNGNALLDA